MHIIGSTFSKGKVVDSYNQSLQNQVKYRLNTLSTDLVSFKGTTNDLKTSIDKNVTDKILKLFDEHQSYNLEFVNNNNEMVYNLKFIATQGNLYLNEYKYSDKGIQKFDSEIVNKYYNMDAREITRLFSGFFQNQFTILGVGRFSNIMFDGSSGEKSILDDSNTLQHTEEALKNILSGLDTQDLKVFNGRIDSAKKEYDDFNTINAKKSDFAKAHKVFLQTNQGKHPSYKQICKLLTGLQDFKLRAKEAFLANQERARLQNLSDGVKYKLALETQRAKANPRPKAKVYEFKKKKPD